jgi:hemolysin activation/secretion protein
MPAVVIPPVRERPLGADEGAKIKVKQFELEGVTDRPGLIKVEEVKELVESQRQKWASGMTIGQMQLVADEVTTYYRNHGLILARAYIAAQTITNDTVKLTVLEGKLGAVHSGVAQPAASPESDQAAPAAESRYSEAMLQKPFVPLQGQAVVKEDFETALLRLLDYPGLKYNAVVKSGTALGTADLYINVTEERLFNAAVSVDNYGSKYTGEYRPRLDIIVNNPTKAADRLGMTFMQTIDPSEEFYWSGSYERPLPWGNNFIGVDFSRNAFDVGNQLDDLNLSGVSETRDIYLKHSFKRSRTGSVAGLVRFSSITAETLQDNETTAKDDLSVLSLEAQVTDYLDPLFGGGVNNLYVTLSHGFDNFLGSNSNDDEGTSRLGGSGEKAPFDSTRLIGNYSRLQRLWPNASLLFRLTGQAANDMLTSVEQFPLGGPDTVRAYQQAQYMMDQGYFTSVELIFNAPGFADRPAFFNRTWGELLQVSVFYDTAGGWLKDALPNEEESGYLSGVGVGVHFGLPGSFLANLSVAKPVGHQVADDGRDIYTYFKLSYQY